jgi:hypothetical protein
MGYPRNGGSGITPEQSQDLSNALSRSHTHLNKATIDQVTAAFTTEYESKINIAATLDGGVLDSDQIPESLTSGLKWQGVFNPASDSLSSASESTNGFFYKLSDDGVVSIEGVATNVATGGWLISNSSEWEYVQPHDSDATDSTKGQIQLAGDLGGTASSPIVETVGGSDPFARGNHTGTQAISTINGLQSDLDDIDSDIAGINGKLSVNPNAPVICGSLVINSASITSQDFSGAVVAKATNNGYEYLSISIPTTATDWAYFSGFDRVIATVTGGENDNVFSTQVMNNETTADLNWRVWSTDNSVFFVGDGNPSVGGLDDYDEMRLQVVFYGHTSI